MKKVVLFLSVGFLVLMGGNASAQMMLANTSFETGDLGSWTHGGQAGVHLGADGEGVAPYDGNYAAWIGTVDFQSAWDVNDYTGEAGVTGYTNNYISQTFTVANMDSLSLYYNVYTWDGYEYYEAYDDPAFGIFINGSPVFNVAARDLAMGDNGGLLYTSGWNLFTYDLSSYNNGDEITLMIAAGNTLPAGEPAAYGDDYQSWAYVDGIEIALAQSAVVPEPASVFLLLSGLPFGYIFSRKKKA
ncbi:MAG: PEP-CTERM sorting domain-containing protein [Candidatus Omnitrophota bacterium]